MGKATLFNLRRRNLRGSIRTAYSLLLLLSFLLIGAIFNIAVSGYISHSSIAALEERERYFYLSQYFGLQRTFAWDTDLAHTPPYYIKEITDALRDTNRWPSTLRNRRVRTEGGVYYVNAVFSHDNGTRWYRVYYVDITDISRFSARVNLLLFILVAIIWFVATLMTNLLAGTLAQPLRQLNRFARQIGRGDFTPHKETFANEEFETLNRSLNHTARQLATYDNEQKTFFQNVSHELRTPLMSIKMYAEGIKYGIMDAQEASSTILDATNRLTGMVGDILYVSRIDNLTAPEKDIVDLADIIAERIRLLETPAQKGLIHYTKSQPVYIPCVKAYIERALDNLISNALRYAEARIDIECHSIGDNAIVRVIDDGPGFEPDSLPRVFERFYRGKNGLTGIGLAIVKSIVDQHGGTALAENTEKGARLTISLPRAVST